MSENTPFECKACQATIDEFFLTEAISTHPFSQFERKYDDAATHILPPGGDEDDVCDQCWEYFRDKEREYDEVI